MRDVVAVLVLGFASALVPLINIEAYLGLRAALADVGDIWLLGLITAIGQMLGKLLWYYVGASSLSWSWIRRRIEQPKQQARLERWRSRTAQRPVFAGATVFVSALVGVPPFAILAVLAGQLQLRLSLFLAVGLVGRWLRFVAVLGGAGWLHRAGLF